MEVEKVISNNNSDTSGDEADRLPQPEKPSGGDNSTASSVARSYECTFCKRGFTNAQALGGHMNIHRKDKLKVKQKSQNKSNSNNTPHPYSTSSPSNSSSRYLLQQQNHQQQFFPSPRGQQHVNFLFYPSYPQVVLPHEQGQSGNFVGANLTLGIGPQSVDQDDINGEESKGNLGDNNEVDLELRLGHNHKYS